MATTKDLSTVPGGLYLSHDGTHFVNASGNQVEEKDLPDGLKAPNAPEVTDEDDGNGGRQVETFGEFPAGYPGAQAFVAAGLTTRASVEGKSDADLIALKDIGTATVAKVREYAKANALTVA
jgi:hypothetical protein